MSALSNAFLYPLATYTTSDPTQGAVSSSSGNEGYITRWMPGRGAIHLKGTMTITSGDVFPSSPSRYYVVFTLTKPGGVVKRWFSSNYRSVQSAGSMNFNFAVPNAELAANTKYTLSAQIALANSGVTSPAQPYTTRGARIQTTFFTNRPPAPTEITSPPSGVSLVYNDSAAYLPLTWTHHDDDELHSNATLHGDADYLGWEAQVRPAPTPGQPAPAWQPLKSISNTEMWALDNVWNRENGGYSTKKMYVQASGSIIAPNETGVPRANLNPGVWQIRMRTFDYSGLYGAKADPAHSGYVLLTPATVPATAASEWSDYVTINVTASFLPPQPLSPVADVGVVAGEFIDFSWAFRDPRTSGGTQSTRRLRIRQAGTDDTAWREIIRGTESVSIGPGYQPSDVVVDATGNIYVLDPLQGKKIHKYNSAMTELLTMNTVGSPSGLSVVGGVVYTVDTTNLLVRKFNAATGAAAGTFAITGDPAGIAVDSAGAVYVVDYTAKLVRKYTAAGAANGTWSTSGAPLDIAVDTTGRIYVADETNKVIRRYSNTGAAQLSFGTTEFAQGLTVADDGTIYAARLDGSTLAKYSATGTLLSSRTRASGFNDVAVAPNGDVIATDYGGVRIVIYREFDLPAETVSAVQSFRWTNGQNFTVTPGLRYEWQVRTVASPGGFDSGWTSPIASFWAVAVPGSGTVIPVPDLTIPDPGLGCGVNRAFLFSRGGINRLGELTQTETVKWGRVRDDISSCTVRITGWDTDCGELLKMVRSWMHEIVVYRDNGSGSQRVWEGPVTRVAWGKDFVEIEARDVWMYAYRRILRHGFNDSYRPSGGLTPVTRRSASILQNALGYDDPNVLAYLQVLEEADDARQSRVVADYSTTAWQMIDDFAAKSGLDYTAAGRRMIVWDTHNPLGVLPEMRDGDFDSSPVVTEYGMQLANYYGVTNNAGVYGTASRLNGQGAPEYYGWIEMLSSAYGESDEGAADTTTLTAAARAALQETLSNQAERNIASRWPTPVLVRVPDNSTLSPDLNIGINHLIPGVHIPLRSDSTLRSVTQMQKLDSMQVTQTKDGEKVQVTLSPAPRSRNEDPDEEAIEE